MTKNIYNQAAFLISAAELKQLPADKGNEVAFIGCSNAGKSSAINAITNIKNLARASKTPGRTQMINLFALDDTNRLVDLPGYGYTKAPAAVSKRWMEKVNDYLKIRECLRGLILVMDVRHPLKEQDRRLLEWSAQCQLPIHILLTKSDKLKRGPGINTLRKVQAELNQYGDRVTIQLFSAHEHTGLDVAHQKLDNWLNL
ncbi:MAG: YihA family ribosome biogenesis GTP-binding protein [Gammaproteobacteria bacterium]|nr:YihA family ribosome biogenesis GTP-binding protein [Gammaproteobacteria bacterium]